MMKSRMGPTFLKNYSKNIQLTLFMSVYKVHVIFQHVCMEGIIILYVKMLISSLHVPKCIIFVVDDYKLCDNFRVTYEELCKIFVGIL